MNVYEYILIDIYNIYIYSAIACDRIGIIGRTDNQRVTTMKIRRKIRLIMRFMRSHFSHVFGVFLLVFGIVFSDRMEGVHFAFGAFCSGYLEGCECLG